MATVVTVMDRPGFDQCTDNIVVVQPRRRRLLWVPRDLWCADLGARVNAAYRLGGHAQLLSSLRGLGVEVDHSICVPRDTAERALGRVTVTVPVAEPLHFWYPLSPQTRIQDGRKAVDFQPPSEELRGERLHQWIGARHSRDPGRATSDLDRIRRQQVLVRALLRSGQPLTGVLSDPEPPAISSSDALADLAKVRWWWTMAALDQVVDRRIDGQMVLELVDPRPRPPRWRRGLARVTTLLVGPGRTRGQ